MKEKLTAIFLFVIFIVFAIFQIVIHNKPVVLKVVTPDYLQIDLNFNNLVDGNENICVENIRALTANLSKFPADLAEDIDLTYKDALSMGYLTDEFAIRTLQGKKVKVQFTGKRTAECQYANVYVDKLNYADLLYDNGYGIRNDGNYNTEKFQRNLDVAKKLKPVILNHKSLKYHNPDCKYGKIAHDAVVVMENELPKDAKPCKFCHLSKYEKRQVNKFTNIIPPPNIATDGNFKLVLTDFTTILKPDRNCTHAVCKEFVNLINSANDTIDIALYGWADVPRVTEAINRAKARGVKFRIVYDTSSKSNYYPETLPFVKQYETARSDECPESKKLTNMLMHNKFAIFDGKKVYTGSMNFSTTGLSGFNHNAVLIINSQKIADLYIKEFNQMFDGKFHTLKAASIYNENIQSGNSVLSVYFSPQDKGLSSAVVPILKQSKHYIYVPTFILTHQAVFDALLDAKRRGLDVRVIIDATSTGVTHSKIDLLRKSGVLVKTENYAGKMHAKSMIVDDEYLVIGSANFSDSAESKNDENMILIKNNKFAKLYRDYFEYFWDKIPAKYLKYNVSAESRYSIGSCSDGIDNDFDGKIDNADEGCKK